MTQSLLVRAEFFLEALIQKQRACPHCGLEAGQTVARKFRVVAIQHCQNCGLFFTSPVYRPLFFSELYEKRYRGEGSTTRLPTSEELTRLRATGFANFDKNFGDRLAAMRDYGAGCQLLEIGSSWGYFVAQAEQYGFQAMGVELSDYRRRFGIEHLQLALFKSVAAVPRQNFDWVYTAHTLEHFTDLSTVFQDIADYLRPGGLLLLEVPNFDFFRFGTSCLSAIGAVHPLGLCSDFFQRNLPKYGFTLQGFYDTWAQFPHQPQAESTGDAVILLAQKVSERDRL